MRERDAAVLTDTGTEYLTATQRVDLSQTARLGTADSNFARSKAERRFGHSLHLLDSRRGRFGLADGHLLQLAPCKGGHLLAVTQFVAIGHRLDDGLLVGTDGDGLASGALYDETPLCVCGVGSQSRCQQKQQ